MKLKNLFWGTFLFAKYTHFDSHYQRLINDTEFLIRLVRGPLLEDFERLREFLVKYGVPWAPKDLHNQYLKIWPSISPYIQRVVNERLETCELSRVSNDIQMAYNCLQWPSVWGGDTSASKVLHFFNPALIIMWDDGIREKYAGGYMSFLQTMQTHIKEILEEFNLKFPGQQLDVFLSKMLGYESTRPLTKFLDDYNWITITKGYPETIPDWLLQILAG